MKTDVPLYPYRSGNITIWPIGVFSTWLPGPELTMALSRGHVQQFHHVVEYRTGVILKDYAEALYKMRCDMEDRGDSEMKGVAKLLLNSLVGRFAQREIRWVPAVDKQCDVLWGEYTGMDASGNPVNYRSVGGQVQVEVDNGFAPDAMPAIAAWITSAARVRLLEYIETAGWSHAYYWDTDCVLVDAVGRQRLIDAGIVQEKTLGMLGERWGPEPVEIHGIKYYVHGGVTVCAGIPPGFTEDTGDGAHYAHQRTPAEDIRAGRKPVGKTVVHSYKRYAEYHHGEVMPDGRVLPFYLEET